MNPKTIVSKFYKLAVAIPPGQIKPVSGGGRVVYEGATRVDIVPLFLGTGGHLREE